MTSLADHLDVPSSTDCFTAFMCPPWDFFSTLNTFLQTTNESHHQMNWPAHDELLCTTLVNDVWLIKKQLEQRSSQGGMGACPPVVVANFFKVNYFCCVEFLCILFSRIFSTCLRHLGALPPDPTWALPLDPAGNFCPQAPSFVPPYQITWTTKTSSCSF